MQLLMLLMHYCQSTMNGFLEIGMECFLGFFKMRSPKSRQVAIFKDYDQAILQLIRELIISTKGIGESKEISG